MADDKKILFVSDLDGTLLNKESVVSPTSAQILRSLIADNDILFTIATARTPATAVPLTAEIGIRLPMVVMTGAAWWEPVEQRYRNALTLPTHTVQSIMQICSSHHINPFVYCARGADFIQVLHAEELNADELSFVAARANLPLKSFYLNDNLVPAESYLVFACNDYSRIQALHRDICAAVECSATCYPDIFDNSKGYLEIFAPSVSKAAAITRLATEIGADRVVVFGDNLNDIPMLKSCDIPVAVGNAFPEVKQVAKYVIDNHDTDAVARWIRDNYDKIS